MTTIDRSSIMRACAQVRPAVSKQPFIPAFTHFCFNEGAVFAYNDTLLLMMSLPDDAAEMPSCCAPADVLTEALRSMGGDTMEVQHDTDSRELHIKAGRSKFNLKTLPTEDFQMHLELPTAEEKKRGWKFDASADFIEGLRACRMAVGNNPNHPASMGITLGSVSGNAVLYATDNVTITRYAVDMEHDGEDDAILPTPFCDALLSFAKAMPNDRIEISVLRGVVSATFHDKRDKHGIGGVIVTKTLTDLAALDYEQIMRKHVDMKRVADILSPLPADMGAVFERAAAVGVDEPRTTLRLVSGSDNEVSVSASGVGAQASDVLVFDGKRSDEALAALDEEAEDVNAAHVLRAVKHTDRLAFVKNALLFGDAKAKLLHLVGYMAPIKKSKR